jgi:branched-chain amino acid transport system substrate-binding protein
MIEDVVKTIKTDIAKGKIRPKEKLPSEETLKGLFRVGRGTIREAIRILEGMGLVEVKKGRRGGVFITDNAGNIASENLADLFKIEESTVMAFTDFRKTIEPQMVFLAALHRTEDNLIELKEVIDLFEKGIQTREIFVTTTQSFFEVITESTQNSFLIAFYKQAIPILAEISKLIYEIPNCVDLLIHFYGQIYESIRGSDPSKAKMLADAYLVQIENSVKNAKNFGVHFGRKNGTIKWGLIVDLTGPTSDYGKQFAMGMIDATRFINENGGINGKKLELIVYTDKYNTYDAEIAYERLRDDGKVLGMHIQSTGTNLFVAPTATQDHMFMFSGGMTGRLLDSKKFPYYFTLGPTYSDMARICMKYLRDNWAIEDRNPRLVFIYPDNVYGRDVLEAGKKYAAKIGVEVGPDLIANWPTLDARPQLLLMKEFDADYAFITSTAMNAANILKDAKRMELRTQFLCNMRTLDEDLPRFSMGLAEGVLGVQPLAPYGSNVPGIDKIIKSHDKWHPYHQPTLVYVEGWINILVPMEASKIADEAGKLTSDGLKEVFETFRDFDTGGLAPPLSYFPDDHRGTTCAKIYEIEKGELKSITDYIDIGRDKEYFGM